MSICVIDFDQDGDKDFLVTALSSSDESVYWYKNDGSESFTRSLVANNVQGGRMLKVADIDNDGDYDVVTVSDTDQDVAWHENDGSRKFY